jgi:hypothetical protein
MAQSPTVTLCLQCVIYLGVIGTLPGEIIRIPGLARDADPQSRPLPLKSKALLKSV